MVIGKALDLKDYAQIQNITFDANLLLKVESSWFWRRWGNEDRKETLWWNPKLLDILCPMLSASSIFREKQSIVTMNSRSGRLEQGNNICSQWRRPRTQSHMNQEHIMFSRRISQSVTIITPNVVIKNSYLTTNHPFRRRLSSDRCQIISIYSIYSDGLIRSLVSLL